MFNSLLSVGGAFLSLTSNTKLFETIGGKEIFTFACLMLGAAEIVLFFWALVESRSSKGVD